MHLTHVELIPIYISGFVHSSVIYFLVAIGVGFIYLFIYLFFFGGGGGDLLRIAIQEGEEAGRLVAYFFFFY